MSAILQVHDHVTFIVVSAQRQQASRDTDGQTSYATQSTALTSQGYPSWQGWTLFSQCPVPIPDCQDDLAVTTKVAVLIRLTHLKSVSQQVLCRRFAEAPCIGRTLWSRTL